MTLVAELFPTPAPGALLFALVFLVSNSVAWIDALDAGVRLILLRFQKTPGAKSHDAALAPDDAGSHREVQDSFETLPFPRPYAVIASVHNVEGKLTRFLEGLGCHRDRLWVVDDASDDRTVRYLEREGISSIRVSPNRKKPAAIRALLAELPRNIVTVIVVDPDITLEEPARSSADPLDELVTRFQRSGCAAVCPRISVEHEGLLSYFQALEYDIAMLLGRRSLGYFATTSGIALYRRDALETTLAEHSLSVYAEDLENTFVLLSRGECIYFDGGVTFRAQCPNSLTQWFSQRVGWAYGLIRVFSTRWRELWRRRSEPAFVYQYFVYLGVLSIVLHPLRVAAALILALSALNIVDHVVGANVLPDTVWSSPYYFPIAYVQYTLLALVATVASAEPGARWRHLHVVPAYFIYVLLSVVPVTTGFLNWFTLRYFGRRVFCDHYDDAPELALGSESAA